MKSEKLPFVDRFNETIDTAERLLWATRDSELQREAVHTIFGLQAEAVDLKEQAINNRNENVANLLLGYECVFEALTAELEMWILIKTGDPDAAWDRLVSAQMSLANAIRAHEAFSHLGPKCHQLEAVERIVFPPQVFVSTGMIVRRQECSICGREYEDCDHIVTEPHLGKFCTIIVRDFEPDHVAIVDNPADKRCRVLQVPTEQGMRNKMTWCIERIDH